jgi:hypothetical protein
MGFRINKLLKKDIRTLYVPQKNVAIPEFDRMSLDYNIHEKSIMINDKIIFQRILGYQEIQDGHLWCVRNKCWICSGWTYALIIWSPYLVYSTSIFEKKGLT